MILFYDKLLRSLTVSLTILCPVDKEILKMISGPSIKRQSKILLQQGIEKVVVKIVKNQLETKLLKSKPWAMK